MSPRGPRIRPSRPTTPITSGVATAVSKSSHPPWIFSTSSSRPASSAPASRASLTLSPRAKTSTRTVLPVPWGRTTVPRTCWSACLGSMPRRMCASTVSSKRAGGRSLRRAMAASGSYSLPRSIRLIASRYLLPCWAITTPSRIRPPGRSHDLDSHAPGRPLDHPHRGLDVPGVQVRELHLRDLPDLLAGDPADLLLVGLAGGGLHARGLLQQDGRRGRLGDEGERPVGVDGDLHGDDGAGLAGRPLVVSLAELHDVDAVLPQRGADRRRRSGLPGGELQLDDRDDLLHEASRATPRSSPPGRNPAPRASPGRRSTPGPGPSPSPGGSRPRPR